MDEAEVNAAFERLLRSYLSLEARQQIEAAFGADVAAWAKEIYDRCLQCPVDWQHQSMDDALEVLARFMETEYPWLTPAARRNINMAFIYEWK